MVFKRVLLWLSERHRQKKAKSERQTLCRLLYKAADIERRARFGELSEEEYNGFTESEKP